MAAQTLLVLASSLLSPLLLPLLLPLPSPLPSTLLCHFVPAHCLLLARFLLPVLERALLVSRRDQKRLAYIDLLHLYSLRPHRCSFHGQHSLELHLLACG